MGLVKLRVPPESMDFVNEALKWGTILLVVSMIAGDISNAAKDPMMLYVMYLIGLAAYQFVVKELIDIVII